jgi:hypothetical protein
VEVVVLPLFDGLGLIRLKDWDSPANVGNVVAMFELLLLARRVLLSSWDVRGTTFAQYDCRKSSLVSYCRSRFADNPSWGSWHRLPWKSRFLLRAAAWRDLVISTNSVIPYFKPWIERGDIDQIQIFRIRSRYRK